MKIFLLIPDEARRRARPPHPEADHAKVDGACPKCGTEDFRVAGSGRYPSKDDRAWEAEGYCLACKAYVGVIRAETNTLFGVREDQAVQRYTVISAGGKVYGT